MTCTIWIIVALALVIFEIMIPSTFFFVCFSVASMFSAIIASLNFSDRVQFAIFISTSIISLYFIKPIFKKIMNKFKIVASNVDAIIGAEVMVSEKIAPLKVGFVKVLGETWRAESDVEFEVGDIVKIMAIRGTTLVVSKVK
jgi:membrane protein implicated in regulation of membrane protease activity